MKMKSYFKYWKHDINSTASVETKKLHGCIYWKKNWSSTIYSNILLTYMLNIKLEIAGENPKHLHIYISQKNTLKYWLLIYPNSSPQKNIWAVCESAWIGQKISLHFHQILCNCNAEVGIFPPLKLILIAFQLLLTWANHSTVNIQQEKYKK